MGKHTFTSPLPFEPFRCPDCKGEDIEKDLMPEDDEYDDDLARECGFDPDDIATYDAHPEFSYIHARMECLNPECGAVYSYGRRWYFDAAKGDYSAEPPLTPRQKAELERQAQEAAGQMRMFGDA